MTTTTTAPTGRPPAAVGRVQLGDCLDLLPELPEGCVDLVYVDPPFGTNRDWGQFDDRWTTLDEYLNYLQVRIEQTKRVLKPTGTFWLHSDPTSSHYIKILLDRMFGRQNFRNEIVWGYDKSRPAPRWFARNHDTIFFYTKSDDWTFNPQRVPTLSGKFELRKPVKRTGQDWWYPTLPGKKAGDWWYDIPNFATAVASKERCGYPTQKPVKLLQRIIAAATNENDVVMDPMCGSGTTLIAAKQLGRRYLGYDINPAAVELSKQRLADTGNPLPGLV